MIDANCITSRNLDKKIHAPRVSIGIPVFNGERYLQDALDSILAQTYPDFEVIISDNASTDRTRDICRGYVAQDRRIHYTRNEQNLGAAKNFNRVFQLSSGEYFKWAAHDDMIDPRFLTRCVAVLDRNPLVVLCFSRVKIIDESGKILGPLPLKLNHIVSSRPQDRFGDLILSDMWCFEVFGLIRSKVLKKTPLIASHIGSDRALRAELGLRGPFFEIPEYLFFSRDHPERSVRRMPAHHLRSAWFDPVNAERTVFPHWRIVLEYLRCCHRVSLTRYERRRSQLHLLRWLGTNLNWARILSDLVIAVWPQSWRSFFRFAEPEIWRVRRENK